MYIKLALDNQSLALYYYAMQKNKVAKLDSELVEIMRKRRNLSAADLASQLGYKTRQGYYAMLKLETLEKVPELAKVFELDKRAFIILDC